MGDWVPWSSDAKKGLKKFVRLEDNGDVTVKRSYDVGGFVEQSKTLLNSGHDGYNEARDMRRVGHIPDFLRQHIIDTEGVDILAPGHEDRLLQALNDPDLKYLVRSNESRLALVNGTIR